MVGCKGFSGLSSIGAGWRGELANSAYNWDLIVSVLFRQLISLAQCSKS